MLDTHLVIHYISHIPTRYKEMKMNALMRAVAVIGFSILVILTLAHVMGSAIDKSIQQQDDMIQYHKHFINGTYGDYE